MAELNPDVLAVQEVESLDNFPLLEGACQPTFRERLNFARYPKNSIGIFSYTDTKIQQVDLPDPKTKLVAVDAPHPMFSFRRYEARRRNLTFQVVAVWPYATKSEDSYRQAHEGLKLYDEWIRQRPTMVIGDFNNNGSYKKSGWDELLKLTDSLGLKSAYHHFCPGEKFGEESRPTHFHHGKEDSKFHLDYCFLPNEWAQHITSVDVGAYDEWSKRSDHVPLIVDLDLKAALP